MKKLLSLVLATATTKDTLHLALAALEEINPDYFSLPPEFVAQINNRIFSLFMRYPTEKDKKILSRIWNHNDGEFRPALKDYCHESAWGRHMLQSFVDTKELFASVYAYASAHELEDFLAQQDPNVLQGLEIDNTDLKKVNHTCAKLKVCKKHGMACSPEILNSMLYNERKNPVAAFEFIALYEATLSHEQWDGLVLKTLAHAQTPQQEATWNSGYVVADSLVLLSRLHEPHKHKASEIIQARAFVRYENVPCFDSQIQSQKDYLTHIMPALLKLDMTGFFVSNTFNAALKHLPDTLIAHAMAPCVSEMSQCTGDTRTSIVMYEMPVYRRLITKPQVARVVLDLLFHHPDPEVAIRTIAAVRNVMDSSNLNNPIAAFFTPLIPEPNTLNTFLQQIYSRHWNSREFVSTLLATRLKTKLEPLVAQPQTQRMKI